MMVIVWLIVGALILCFVVPVVALAVVLIGMGLNLLAAVGLWVLGLFAPRSRS
jgi:hypothetical protein